MSALDGLFPQTLAKVHAWLAKCSAVGLDVRPYSGYRSFADQAQLYAAFQSGGPKAAPPGHSFHNVRRAVDFFCYRNGQQIEDGEDPAYRRAGELAEGLGLAWGGRWNSPDWDHVEDEYCARCGHNVAPNNPMHFNESGEEAA